MQVLRLAIVALLAVCATSGCRTAGVGDLARPDPPLASGTANVAEILAEHNRNAERIQVMQARPDLTVTVDEKASRASSHPLSGRMAMEQPRNFKLVLYHTAAGMMGDIGSNDTEYWFWVKDKTQRAIYYCNYDEAESNRQAATFQPDWIKEAMGLRVIPEAEASEITLKPGDPGTLVLTHRPHKSGGVAYTRVTIIDKATHRILEHRLLTGDQKTILAWAKVPEGYMEATDLADSGSGKSSVLIPKRLQLRWVQEGLTLDVTFRDVQINNPIKQSQREDLFVEPHLGKSYSRINLAERIPGTASPTTIRETRPAPPSRVRLREPAPIEGEEAARDERSSSPIALNGAEPMTSSLSEEVVGPRYPTAPEPDFLKGVSAGWRAAATTGPLP
jgi:hypothetical protein